MEYSECEKNTAVNNGQLSTPRADFDHPWKGILDLYFKDFMALCWPEKHNLIDWAKGFTMLDKDLLKITRDAAVGNRSVDKLIEIHCLNGEATYLILHLEIQRSPQPHFEKRMFQYRYRLLDLHDVPVASLAVLIDDNPSWRPTYYREEVWGSAVEMTFPIIKLTDYQNQIAELEQSTNPFAHVILAQLAVNKKQEAEARLATKFELTRNLYKLGWSGKDIRALYKFIDWIIILPPDLDLVYNEKLLKIEEEIGVHYVTTAERIGIQKGIEQGLQQVAEHVTTAERIGIQKGIEQGLQQVAEHITTAERIGIQKGIEQGLQQAAEHITTAERVGIQKGIEQGMQQGEFAVVLHLLEKKFNNVPAPYREKIRQMDTTALLELAGQILQSQSLEELF